MLVPALGEGSALNSDAEEYNGRHGVSPPLNILHALILADPSAATTAWDSIT